jgi:nucleoside-diphosphate-sugar epimerase
MATLLALLALLFLGAFVVLRRFWPHVTPVPRAYAEHFAWQRLPKFFPPAGSSGSAGFLWDVREMEASPLPAQKDDDDQFISEFANQEEKLVRHVRGLLEKCELDIEHERFTFAVSGGGGAVGRAVTRLVLKLGHKCRVLDLPHVIDAARKDGRWDEFLQEELPGGDSAVQQHAPYARHTKPRAPRLSLHPVDLVSASDSLEGVLSGCDAVIHTAGIITYYSNGPGEAQISDAVNVEGTRNLVDAAQKARVPVFCHTSTSVLAFEMGGVNGGYEHATPIDGPGLDDDAPLVKSPLNHYVRTKMAAEKLVLAANCPDFLTAAIRPGAICGPHDSFGLLRAHETGLYECTHSGNDGLQDWIHVDDVASALLLTSCRLLAQGQHDDRISGKVFNISSGVPGSLRLLMSYVCFCLPKQKHARFATRSIPPFVEKVLTAIASLAESRGWLSKLGQLKFLTRTALRTSRGGVHLSIRRARDVLGWELCYPTLREMATALNRTWMFEHVPASSSKQD